MQTVMYTNYVYSKQKRLASKYFNIIVLQLLVLICRRYYYQSEFPFTLKYLLPNYKLFYFIRRYDTIDHNSYSNHTPSKLIPNYLYFITLPREKCRCILYQNCGYMCLGRNAFDRRSVKGQEQYFALRGWHNSTVLATELQWQP